MRVSAFIFVLLAGFQPLIAAEPESSGVVSVVGKLHIGLERPDQFTGAVGMLPVLELWTKAVMRTRQKLVVVGSDMNAMILAPIFRLREQRPDQVVVHVIADRALLGRSGEVAESLVKAGIGVSFTSALAGRSGWMDVPPVAGLLLVRDDEVVVLVSGASDGNALAWGWQIESAPIAVSYGKKMEALKSLLPSYPAAAELLKSSN